jgi:hypothetical protein
LTDFLNQIIFEREQAETLKSPFSEATEKVDSDSWDGVTARPDSTLRRCDADSRVAIREQER